MNKDNNITSLLSIIGGLSVVGIFGGYNVGNDYVLGELQTVLGWTIFLSGLVWGIVFFGFAEIIKLLQGIFNQRENSENITHVREVAATVNNTQPKVKITESVKSEINEFYRKKGLNIRRIEETPKEDIFKVILEDDSIETVELGGFSPKIIW